MSSFPTFLSLSPSLFLNVYHSLTDDVTPADLARIFATMGDRVALVKKRKKASDLSVAGTPGELWERERAG